MCDRSVGRENQAIHLTVVSDMMDLSLSDVDIPDEITELDLNQLHEFSQGLLVETEAKVRAFFFSSFLL